MNESKRESLRRLKLAVEGASDFNSTRLKVLAGSGLQLLHWPVLPTGVAGGDFRRISAADHLSTLF